MLEYANFSKFYVIKFSGILRLQSTVGTSYIYYASGRDRKICCNITENEIVQSIWSSVHTIKLENCFLLKFKPY